MGVLVVAATEAELCGQPGLVCGIGPVEAAAATAAAIAARRPDAVLNVGVAGGRGLPPRTLVVGDAAVYCDLSAAIDVVDRVAASPALVAACTRALPAALIEPIETSASVAASSRAESLGIRVQGMEGFGVLRAAERAGIPAVEVRVISNEIGEPDRSKWHIRDALAFLEAELPALVTALRHSAPLM